jgi:hypothetical protein
MSTHMLTPEPADMPPPTGSGIDDEAYTPERLEEKFPPASEDPGKIRMRPSGLAARAEDASLPGTFVTEEKPTLAEEEAEDRAAHNSAPAQQDQLTDPEAIYVSERHAGSPASAASAVAGVGERHARWAAFEEHLRRNRVDITASCRSCGAAKENAEDKVA